MMRKRIIAPLQQAGPDSELDWLNLDRLAEVEMTSEDAAYPVESALLLTDYGSGWRAAEAGKQTIRLLFANPLQLQRIRLEFVEEQTARTQEFVLRWSPDGGHSFEEILRQQWNFNPQDSSSETEEYQLNLQGVTVLELVIIPDISGGEARASLARLRLA